MKSSARPVLTSTKGATTTGAGKVAAGRIIVAVAQGQGAHGFLGSRASKVVGTRARRRW